MFRNPVFQFGTLALIIGVILAAMALRSVRRFLRASSARVWERASCHLRSYALERMRASDLDKAKIYEGNARRFLRLKLG